MRKASQFRHAFCAYGLGMVRIAVGIIREAA